MRRCLMSFTVSLLGVLLAAAMVRWTAACGDYGTMLFDHLADGAILADERVAGQSVARLRNLGPRGLDALVERHAALLDLAPEASADETADRKAKRDRLIAAMEQVAGQRDCRASRLYWYTDLEKAKAASKHQNKPILSLRMMGKLTDEYSCANSRFFRTTLYANSEISKLLREKFVLHWESVRPVPKVSIDFGDGRKLERTLTGNSIHYVLASDGRVIDALPGLYSAKAFLEVVKDADVFFHSAAGVKEAARDAFFARYYRDRMSMIESNWASDLRRVGVELAMATNPALAAQAAPAPAPAQPNGNPPNAAQAGMRAIGRAWSRCRSSTSCNWRSRRFPPSMI